MTAFYILLSIAATAIVAVLVMRSRSAGIEKDLAVAESSLAEARDQLRSAEEQLRNERMLHMEKANALTQAETRLCTLKEQIAEQQQALRKDFESLANRILEDTGKKFADQNRSNLDLLLSPLKEKIKEFELKVDTVYKSESAERNSLKGEIKSLIEMNQRISKEANDLAVALKGDNKQQGNWGEFVLEKVLENSGLQKGVEYKTQVTTENSDGDKIKPDVVVFLPEEKHLIIDSKVSLVAYEQLVHAAEADADKLRKAHVESVRNHIRALSEKHYHTASEYSSPDFVMMFIPVESSFSMAVRADDDLFTFAWEKRIVMVSPSTLLATLRTVAAIWKQDRQTRNAIEIAEEGGKLYDKFVGFVEDLVKLGRKLDESKKDYADAMNKLTEGSGNLVRRAEKMKELGAKANKAISQQLIDRAG